MLLATRCSDDDAPSAVDKGFDYFPLEAGRYAIYNVNEIHYSSISGNDTLAYQLMMEVSDSFVNNTGTITYVINRSKRNAQQDEWEFLETWSSRRTTREAVMNEGNISFVKLAFPLKQGIQWDGNKFNNSTADDYEIKDVGLARSINGIDFTETLTVEQESYDDQVTRTDIRTEVYAREVGLVYKETKQLTYCTEQVCLNDGIIESGLIYKQEIVEYGVH
jgi:hypothetical protein